MVTQLILVQSFQVRILIAQLRGRGRVRITPQSPNPPNFLDNVSPGGRARGGRSKRGARKQGVSKEARESKGSRLL